jgi:hypothetical protein
MTVWQSGSSAYGLLTDDAVNWRYLLFIPAWR